MFTKKFSTLKDVLRLALRQRLSALIFLFGSFASSVTEMIFLGFLYTLFSDTKKAAVLEFVKYRMPSGSDFAIKNFTTILVISTLVILLSRLFFAISSRFAMAQIQVRTGTDLSNKLISCFADAHPAAWMGWKKEKIVNIITSEAAATGELVYAVLSMVMAAMVMITLASGAFLISPQLTVLSVCIGLVIIAMNYSNYVKARKIGLVKVKSKAELLGNVYDVVSGHKIIKLEAGEEFVKTRSARVVEDSLSWLLKKARNINMVMSFSELLVYFFFFGLVAAAQILRIADQAILLTLLVISIRIQGSVREIQTQWMAYQELLPNLLDVQEMLNHADSYAMEQTQVKAAIRSGVAGGITVRLDRISFNYPGSGMILKDLNVEFLANKRYLIRGGSGCGKSTLINIIAGALDPSSGKIFLGDTGLDRSSFYSLRRDMSYSSPDAYIFRATIKENVSLGMEASDKEVALAISKAGLDGLVGRLDKGMYSCVSDNASDISLGERQRLMLARMFLKKPRLILLDEATSNLDLELENKILNNLITHLPDATLIMVTHRAPKNLAFDKRFELQNGGLQYYD